MTWHDIHRNFGYHGKLLKIRLLPVRVYLRVLFAQSVSRWSTRACWIPLFSSICHDKCERLRISRIKNDLSVIMVHASRQLRRRDRLKDHTSITAIRITRPRGRRVIHLCGINQGISPTSLFPRVLLCGHGTPRGTRRRASRLRCGPLTSSYAPDLLSLSSSFSPLPLSRFSSAHTGAAALVWRSV